MAEGLDIDAMLQRFKDRAVAVKNRNLNSGTRLPECRLNLS